MATMSRKQYGSMFGPTVGDRVRLADTNLVIEIEQDYTAGHYGDEVVYGGGKTVRDGMAADPGSQNATIALDLVITNAVVLDPMLGVVKGDIGIKDGKIVGIGKSGNPHTQNGVDRRLIIGAGTEVIAGENMIATAGRDRPARPLRLAAAGRGRAHQRHHHADRRRHRPHRRHPRHDLHAGPVEHRAGCCRPSRRCRSTSASSARATPACPAR